MRFIPLTDFDREKMLATIGVQDIETLFGDIPPEARQAAPSSLPKALGEQELGRYMAHLAGENRVAQPENIFLGAGAYPHFVPVAVDQLLLRSELFTAYTPYQPEISQGTLMAIYEFQTYTASLFGMDIANASMYDGASALAEAVIMAGTITKKPGVLLSGLVPPAWREVVATYSRHRGGSFNVSDDILAGLVTQQSLAAAMADDTGAIVVAYPNFLGHIEDLKIARQVADRAGAMLIVAVPEPVALGLLSPPGAYGADIVVGEGRSFGGSLSYGGPGLGMFATRDKWARRLPGRLVGKTDDVDGASGYVLTLATREQHIRRDKATSNICSNQALCATAAAIHLSLLGKEGLRLMAKKNLAAAHYLKEQVSALKGFEPVYQQPFFNEVAVRTPIDPALIQKRLAEQGMVAGYDLSNDYPELESTLLLCATELHNRDDIDRLVDALSQFEK